jgi:hypothetical protein
MRERGFAEREALAFEAMDRFEVEGWGRLPDGWSFDETIRLYTGESVIAVLDELWAITGGNSYEMNAIELHWARARSGNEQGRRAAHVTETCLSIRFGWMNMFEHWRPDFPGFDAALAFAGTSRGLRPAPIALVRAPRT